jgi:predicted nucleic acid-binding protein
VIVLDAAAAVDLLEARAAGAEVGRAMRSEDVRVPIVFDAEVFAAIRRAVVHRRMPVERALPMLVELRRLLVTRHPVDALLGDALALRDRFGAHEVFYALLARRLGATLLTTDEPLSRAAAGFCDVRYVSPTSGA